MDHQVLFEQGDELMGASRKTRPTAELQSIAADLRRMHDGGAWHGPSLTEALDGVTADMAAAHPIPGAHSIFELVHHIGAWIGEVTRRVQGAEPGAPADGDFPAPDVNPTDEAWNEMCRLLERRHAELEAAILALDPAVLDETVGGERDAPLGTGMTYRATLHGAIEHDAYHAGQLMLLRKALGR